MARHKRVGQKAARRRAVGLGLLIIAELVLLLGAFLPLMEAGTAVDANTPANLSYLWWNGTVNKPGVFVLVSLIGGALGGALHAGASLTAHVAAGDFDPAWTMWYLANPFLGASLATAFLFVLQAGLGGQVAPTTGGLYAIAALATLTGLFSRHALDKLKEIFNVAFASQDAADSRTTDAGTTDAETTDAGTTGAETNGRRHNGYRHNGYRLAAYPSAHRTGSGPQQRAKPNNGGVARGSGKGSTA
jgi:hypothetical protein